MHVTANGSSIFVETVGPPDGPPVLLVHSLTADHSAWRRLVPVLADRFRVIAPDLRGHGASPAPPPPYSMATLAADMAGILDRLAVESAHVIGLSIGGMIAQQLALDHPQRVRSLVLAATACEMTEARKAVWDDRIRQVEADGVASLVDSTLERWFTPPTHRDDPALIQACAAMIRATTAEGYVGCAAAIRDMALTDRLGEIAVPTLVLSGAEDPSTPPELQAQIRDGIPGARMETFEATAHQIALERPDRFNTLVTDFLRLVEAP